MPRGAAKRPARRAIQSLAARVRAAVARASAATALQGGNFRNAGALAAFVLADRPKWTPERIAAAMNGERTQRVDLPAPVPIFIYYTTAIVRLDGTIEFFEDIYGKDEALDRALRAGHGA